MIQAVGLALSGLLIADTAYAVVQKSPHAAKKSVTIQGVQVAIDRTMGRLLAPDAAQLSAFSRAPIERPAASSGLRSHEDVESSVISADEAAARKVSQRI